MLLAELFARLAILQKSGIQFRNSISKSSKIYQWTFKSSKNSDFPFQCTDVNSTGICFVQNEFSHMNKIHSNSTSRYKYLMRLAWNIYICNILSYLSHVSYCVVRKSWLIASMRKKSCYRHNWIFGEYPLLFIEIQYTTCYIFQWISFFFWYVILCNICASMTKT